MMDVLHAILDSIMLHLTLWCATKATHVLVSMYDVENIIYALEVDKVNNWQMYVIFFLFLKQMLFWGPT